MSTVQIDDDVKALRKIAERKQAGELAAGVFALLFIGLIVGWFIWTTNATEAEKKWCREANAKDFVEQYQSRCAQHSSDPAIRARIDRILSGEEK